MASEKPVTAVASFHFMEGVDVDDKNNSAHKLWQEIMAIIAKQPGYHGLYYGNSLEDPSLTQLLIDWAPNAHEEFAASDNYAYVIESLNSLTSGAPNVHHLEPSSFPISPCGKAPVLELCTFYNTEPNFSDRIERFLVGSTQVPVDGHYGHVWGPVVEEIQKTPTEPKGRGAMMLIGWESREAHYAFSTTAGYKEFVHTILEGYNGNEWHHTVLKAY